MSSLRDHMKTHHSAGGVKLPRSNEDLAKMHKTQHWRLYLNHYHAGNNRGPGERPDGWTTGLDVVERMP